MNGTLLEAWAGMKSFQGKDGKTPPYDPGNATVDRHGEKRTNQTPESKTAGSLCRTSTFVCMPVQ